MANPLLNERDYRGTKLASTNADFVNVARLVPDKKSAAYAMFIRVVGIRRSNAAADQPAAYVYWRYALFVTSAAGVVTQVGATETIGTDKETDAGATLLVVTDGTNVDVKVSAAYPTNWSANVDTVVSTQELQ